MWHTQYADIIYIYMCVCDIYIYTKVWMRSAPPADPTWSWKILTNALKMLHNLQSAVLYQSDVQGSGPITPSPRPCLLELTNSSNMSFGDHAMQLMGSWKVSQLEAPRMRLCKALACATLLLVAVLHCPRLATGAGGQDRLGNDSMEKKARPSTLKGLF